MKKLYTNGDVRREKNSAEKFRWRLYLSFALLFLSAFTEKSFSQSFTIDQVRNGPADAPYNTNTDPSTWVNGNLTPQHAHYAEGYSVPYRAVATGLTIGVPVTLVIGYDTRDNDRNALDYLTYFQRLDPHAVTFGHSAEIINPTLGVTGVNATIDYIAITPPASIVLADNQPPGSSQPLTSYNALPASEKRMTIFGGTFVPGSFSYVSQDPLTGAHSQTTIQVTFTPLSSTIVLAWGGHIASRLDWGSTDGVPNSAGGISGSPYHMRLIEYKIGTTTTSLGNQDRSLKASAVAAPPPVCQVIPTIHDICVGGNATFTASATSGTPPYTFNWYRNENFTTSVNTGTTFSFTNVQFSDSGSIEVIVTDAAGAKDTCHAQLNVIPLPPCGIAAPVASGGGGTITCNTNGHTVSTSTAIDTSLFTLVWSITDTTGQTGWSITAGQGSNTITFNAGECGAAGDSVKFNLVVTDKTYGCVSNCSRKLVPVPVCSVSINAHGKLTCDTTQITLTAVATTDNPNPAYSWVASNGGNIVSGSNTASVVINQPGRYKVTITDQVNGCVARDSTDVIRDDAGPRCSISGVGINCDTLTRTYTGPAASGDTTYSYRWRVTGTAAIVGDSLARNVVITATGYCNASYTVKLQVTNNVNGCKSNCEMTYAYQDTTDPVLGNPGRDTTINCPGSPVFTAPTATDNCDDAPVVNMVKDTTIAGQCAGTYIRQRSWQATDACGNMSAIRTQSITVQDTTVPTIAGAGRDTTINCPGVPVFTAPTGNDACDNSPNIVLVKDTTIAGQCAGAYVRAKTWKAVDDCGNESAPITQTITVQDTTAPDISAAGRDTTLNCPANPSFTAPTATDACDNSPTIVVLKDTTIAGQCAGSYVRIKQWKAVDDCGNESAPVTQTITVQDTTAPDVSAAGRDTTLNCPASPSFTAPTATDACDNSPSIIVLKDTTIAGQCAGTYVRIKQWKAVDDCGNESPVATQTVTVQDTTPPVLSGGGRDTVINCPATPVFTAPTATDACDESPDIVLVKDTTIAGSCPGAYTRTKTWKAVDDCGNNSNEISQTIVVQDTTAPAIGDPGADTTIVCSGEPAFTPPTATDACDSDPEVVEVSTNQTSNSDGSVTYTRTWAATDTCGNDSREVSQSITVPTCRKENCSLTQGFYGNTGGIACATGQGTLALIQSLLSGSNLVVGKPGRSLTITQANAECIIMRLPSGGPASMLPAGNGVFSGRCETSTNIPLKNNRFRNILLGQTITLGLNLRLDGGLGAVLITDVWMITKGADKSDDGLCGTTDDVIIDSLVIGKYIPPSVIAALNTIYGSATVANLFDLGNRALGGMTTGGASLDDINTAISSINEGFDGCRFLVGFRSTPPPSERNNLNTQKTKALGYSIFKDAPQEKFKVFPNPFNETINFELDAPTNGTVNIEFFTAAGAKVATIYQGEAGPGKALKFDLNTQKLPAGLYLCKFTNSNNITVVKKVILMR